MSDRAKSINGPVILLNSGSYFNILEPASASFTLEDIAHGLSHVCRFAGQAKHYYSVAEHSVLMAQCVPAEYRKTALLHDASEAFIGDMTKPLKHIMPAYQEIERKVEAAIYERFAVEPMGPAVKEYDKAMLAIEQNQVMQNHDDWEWTKGAIDIPVTVQFWSPSDAKLNFLEYAASIGLSDL